MLEIMANGAVTLIAALFGWWLGRGSRQDRQRNKLRAELEIMERLPEGPERDRMQRRVNDDLDFYLNDHARGYRDSEIERPRPTTPTPLPPPIRPPSRPSPPQSPDSPPARSGGTGVAVLALAAVLIIVPLAAVLTYETGATAVPMALAAAVIGFTARRWRVARRA
jgi:hypothetical protein